MSVLSADVLAAAGKSPTAGWGLLVLLVLAVGCFLLFLSMTRHLRKAKQMRIDAAGPARPAPITTRTRRQNQR